MMAEVFRFRAEQLSEEVYIEGGYVFVNDKHFIVENDGIMHEVNPDTVELIKGVI